jgi:serine phosphatase RsbU (regulator of sigma subunit)
MRTETKIIQWGYRNGKPYALNIPEKQSQPEKINLSEQVEKNKELLESINYAKRLQEAIMPSATEISEMIGEHFILNRPKDIVGGDFYFVEPIRTHDGRNLTAIAVADCTGHGVPGALMTMSGYGILKNSVSDKNVNSPSEALDFLNSGISKIFRQDSKSEKIRDGMDISFCALDSKTRMLEFAGANNKGLVIKKDKTVVELVADKQPVGYNETAKPFNTTKIQLEEGDVIYLFSDGFKDQFGGQKGKKLGFKKLLKMLKNISHENCDQQKKLLELFFEAWKGELEQVDDVLIFGIKI